MSPAFVCLVATRANQVDGALQAGQRVQVNGPRWRRVSLALLDVLRRSGPATVVRSCSEMPLFRPGNAPRSAMGSVPIKSVNLNSLPWIPKDLPPRSTLHDYFDRWDDDGTLGHIHHALYVACRELAGRDASPSAAIIDS